MTIEPRLELAQAIAERLSRANTDHNEMAKASSYLNQTRDAEAFFTWLDWMATPRVSEKLARSRQTPEYYRQIRDACQQLRAIEDVDEMAQTLGWAVRLMRYIPYARPVDPRTLAALLEPQPGKQPVSPQPRRSAATATAPNAGRITDLRPGQQLTGMVKRTAKFGAFVDVGVGRDGLVHISKLKQGFVPSTEDVVQVGQQVTVWVESVDVATGKIALTMILPRGGARPAEPVSKPAPAPTPPPAPQPVKPATAPRPEAVQLSPGEKPEPGQWVKGRITVIEQNRLVVDVGQSDTATLMYEHIPGQPDQMEAEERYEIGQEIEVRVRRINQRGRVQLTLLEG